MGLDITAYNSLRYVGHHEEWDDEDAHYDQHVEAFAYKEFPHALMGVPDVRIERFRSGTEYLAAGCFEVTDKTEEHDFRAGAYTGYNQWRDDLRERYNPDKRPEGWFYELINFADNEGTICEIAASTLRGNFRQFEVEYATEHGERDGGWWVRKYRDWMRAFELAADGGLVRFH